jgi:glycosyltransferase involved in cell wall biosynthesis
MPAVDMNITFVIPVYNERETLEALAAGIAQHVAPHPYRILFVDDGSTDGSYDEMRRLQAVNPAIEIIRLRGNFGKSAALAAGFAKAAGDYVFTMDSDLQDDPQEIPRFLDKMKEGHDIVCGWKAKRYDPLHKTLPSHLYNRFVSWLFSLPLHDVNCGFKLFRLEVVKRIQLYGEMHRLIPVMAHNLNYRVAEIPVEHHPRRFGKSKYGIGRFMRGAADVLTMWFLTRHMHAPGHFFTKLGLAQKLLGGAMFVAGVCFWLGGRSVLGPTLLVSGIVIAAAGALTLCLGLLAELMLRHFVRIDPALYIAETAEAPRA